MNVKKYLACAYAFVLVVLTANSQTRSVERMDTGWRFHLGSASYVENDYRNGTEYFNYLTKAHSIHNEGPYILKFDDTDW